MTEKTSEKNLRDFLKRNLGTKLGPGTSTPGQEYGIRKPKPEPGANKSLTEHPELKRSNPFISRNTDDDKTALVSIQGGQVRVYDPKARGGRAKIYPPAKGKLRLLVNGQLVPGIATVSETDHIMVEPVLEQTEPELRLQISKDGLEAHLTIGFGRTINYVPTDQEPQSRLTLRAEPVILDIAPPTYEMALELLNRQGLIFGIDHPHLKAIFEKPTEGTYPIAQGKPPQPGEPDRVELFFNPDPFVKNVNDTGKVNFREFRQLQSVDAGTCLAVLRRGTPGEPGVTVLGEEIPPPKQQRITLVADSGTRVTDEGTKVEATIYGLPTVKTGTTNYVFKVDSVFHHKGDLTILNSNLRFQGNVHVEGNVEEGMTVAASANVLIGGSVNHGKVAAAGHACIQSNVFSSSIQAGYSTYHLLEAVQPELQEVVHRLGLLVGLVSEVMNLPEIKKMDFPFNVLVLNLLEIKYPQLRGQMLRVCASIRKLAPSMPPEITEMVEELEITFTGVNLNRFNDLRNLEQLHEKLQFINKCAENAVTSNADIRVPYAINSRLEATGRVFITGSGIYHCTVVAGGDVTINGVLRGGMVLAKGNVHIEEAGSRLGVPTWVRVPGNRTISVARAFPDVVLQVGPRKHRLLEPKQSCKVRLLNDGKLNIQSQLWDGK